MTIVSLEVPSLPPLLHQIVRDLNPWEHEYVKVCDELSSSLNPYRNSHEIRISAAIACMDLPDLKTASVFEVMKWDYERGRYQGVDTLVVPYGNTAQAVGIFAPAFGIKQVRVVLPGDEYTALEGLDRSCTRVFSFGHPRGRHIHECRTGPLLAKAAGGPIGLVAVAMGSGNTAIGLSRYFREAGSKTIILGVRPKKGERVPGTLDSEQMDRLIKFPYHKAIKTIVEVSRAEALAGALALRGEVTPQPGFSSGLAYAGLMKLLSESSSADDVRGVLRGQRAVVFCPDNGRAYPELTVGGTYPSSSSSPRL